MSTTNPKLLGMQGGKKIRLTARRNDRNRQRNVSEIMELVDRYLRMTVLNLIKNIKERKTVREKWKT